MRSYSLLGIHKNKLKDSFDTKRDKLAKFEPTFKVIFTDENSFSYSLK